MLLCEQPWLNHGAMGRPKGRSIGSKPSSGRCMGVRASTSYGKESFMPRSAQSAAESPNRRRSRFFTYVFRSSFGVAAFGASAALSSARSLSRSSSPEVASTGPILFWPSSPGRPIA